MKTIRVKLTDEQQKQLKPLYDYSKLMNNKGKPGSIIAQPFDGKDVYEHELDDIMVCYFIPNEKVLKIIEVLEED